METIDKNNLNRLSDDELFQALKKCGLNAGPITGTTRTLYEKRLKNFLETNPGRTTTKANEPPAQPSTSTKPVIETLTSADKAKPTRSTATKKKAQTQAEKMELDGEAEASIPITRSSQSNPRVYATTSDENTVPTIPSTQPLRQRETVAPATTTRTTIIEPPSVERVSTTARAQPNRYEPTATTRNSMNDLPSSSTASSSARVISHTNKNPIENISSKTNYNDYESSERRYENKTYSSSNMPANRITNPVTTSSMAASSYETISRPSTSSYTSLSSTTTKPVLQSSSYTSNIMTTRFEPMQASNTQKDKYAERQENYGLISRSEMESGSGAYVSTPSYVRSRGPIHSFEKTVEKHVDTPYVNKTAPKTAMTATTTSANSIQTNVKENKSSMFDINWKYLISVMILTIIVYFLMVQMHPNPENPIDH
jgi:hypothetical protein